MFTLSLKLLGSQAWHQHEVRLYPRVRSLLLRSCRSINLWMNLESFRTDQAHQDLSWSLDLNTDRCYL